MNYRAIIREGVKLIVNLTESPVSPLSNTQCASCNFNITENCCYEEDIFEDVEESDNLQVLFLPVRDGYVPTFEQLEIFLFHANEVISKGHKVIVHCHAGVGRTGLFLAAYLMDKYGWGPEETISKLRFYRPHSMQFNPDDVRIPFNPVV
jgi:protein-tyrosine phosphatase